MAGEPGRQTTLQLKSPVPCDSEVHSLLKRQGRIPVPGYEYWRELLRERAERISPDSDNGVKARSVIGRFCRVSFGISPYHYRFFLLNQARYYLWKFRVRIEGWQNIPQEGPLVYVMKHRHFADITLHALGHGLSSIPLCEPGKEQSVLYNFDRLRALAGQSALCRFVMKNELLDLPIGVHLTLNGGIPFVQDLETKAKNTPGFDPEDPKVKERQERLSKYASFKDGYRELLSWLKNGGCVAIYGESTRVKDNKMGHLSMRLFEKLQRTPGLQFVPVGTEINGIHYTLRYGSPCGLEELRTKVGQLSGIDEKDFLS